jgi:hypothetical protein
MLLQCHVQSNPPSSRIRWIHNGKEIKHDVEKGIFRLRDFRDEWVLGRKKSKMKVMF